MRLPDRRASVPASGSPVDLDLAGLLLAAERAVDTGADILRLGRSHIGALIGRGDRDFATSVDLQIESTIRELLADTDPSIPFLGEEGGGASAARASWVLDPIDGTINFSRDSPLCTISLSLVIDGQPVLGIVDAPLLGERFVARQGGEPPRVRRPPGTRPAGACREGCDQGGTRSRRRLPRLGRDRRVRRRDRRTAFSG